MENKEISLDTFSILSNAGWLLIILKLAGVISTNWNAILNYWLALLGISVAMGIVTAIIGLWTKAGDK
ncbi:hypothetical protein [Lacticaseibacillus paracasei]|uniref:Uncharacterized protein n=1 Tax=Lacticaseibacillus paracasei TaxID=1597 RepID=A0ABD6VW78_LACPA|nr:hypothetical protein [Lacticaseibacillus paracasei]MCT3379464.1 hypothetical protein [Lacticaseibacillus paracasei]POE38086.1 hypothetical protein ACX51_15915 [Lacticaseibacillus paracasei]QHV91703.1 hypothetical protein EOK76_g1252 [Lacticaseibacillus paracasei]